jgi:hypothetical protein
VCAANRIGHEHVLGTDGKPSEPDGLAVLGPVVHLPRRMAHSSSRASVDREEILVVVDLARVEFARTHWPFLRDRRIDAYGDITKRFIGLTRAAHRHACRDSAPTPRPKSRLRLPGGVGAAARHVALAGRAPRASRFPDYYTAPRGHRRIAREIARAKPVHVNVPNGNYERIVLELRSRRAASRSGACTCTRSRPTSAGAATTARPSSCGRIAGRRDRHRRLGLQRVGWQVSPVGRGRCRADARSPRSGPAGVPRHRHGRRRGRVNGAGTLLTTKSCLLNRNRNPGLSKAGIESYLCDYYGQSHVLWLDDGIAGDDTDGHIDDLARFIDARTIVMGIEADPGDENYRVLQDNRRRVSRLRDQDGRPFEVVEIPMPRAVVHEGQRLPATYVNFLFINGALLVPTFRDRRNDARALAILQRALPDRQVVGIDCTELVWGLGTIHCLTQQIPAF